jgi:hypothetical protein
MDWWYQWEWEMPEKLDFSLFDEDTCEFTRSADLKMTPTLPKG